MPATITNGSKFMQAVTYTGTGATQTIAVGFQPDFVWIKSRSAATDNKLTDSVRGATKALISNSTGAETTDANGVTAFTSNGFTIGSDSVYNTNGATYVAWCWKAGTSSSSNTNGSITSTVSVNATAGFSVVSFSGNGTSSATLGHGLGVAPKMLIVKNRNQVGDWGVYHVNMNATPQNYYMQLNLTSAAGANSTIWNNTAPTSSVFSVGSYFNGNGVQYIGYAFAEIAGFSKFGSYTGNGSADGSFVYTGFRPKFILIKRTDTIGNWTMYDATRNPYNAGSYPLYPNLSNAEDPSTDHFDWLSNGFKMKSTNQNTSGGTFIYACFATNPFAQSNAV